MGATGRAWMTGVYWAGLFESVVYMDDRHIRQVVKALVPGSILSSGGCLYAETIIRSGCPLAICLDKPVRIALPGKADITQPFQFILREG